MIKAKKSLGQNFLVEAKIINQILDIIDIKNKNILEIGPGTGNLTYQILNRSPKNLIVIEKDEYLANLLQDNLGSKITIINQDVLEVDENSLKKEKLIVFGNLPYNISTEILCKWINNIKDENIWFDYLILMFQKEVADRIISKFNTKNYGRLSILSNWKLNIKKIFDIKPSSFAPKPKVDSTVLLFEPKRKYFKINNPKNLEKITRIFFSERRKMIKKPYNLIFNGNLKIADKLKIKLDLRPQNLDYDTYYKITSEYENLGS
ncbi:16S rRNA (adenine(1518)-N(6)/adenine(1519)-N(6))-dimethyltransferase RsmA [Candidatus Pelagibacter sp.]|nr:16S rRNA (adenine(1518)-N(6)/adenine(1519)-N(6))-dimethyltransferase RsmA [Candidatus Pelagibacter sp.]MDC3106621.1 16S rRNA (adenine(1518)-N(6)/adenine(1519)-N(6))-dimethyltransferase RsmA [Candidatus Pelagibacter sp.]MDC3135468.1 16S rRNA (adenine(1518)-N(6)/adenine(1519)-N(6))-dimethyltransferase RsmA [Candidatus Pelagibacter sp.]